MPKIINFTFYKKTNLVDLSLDNGETYILDAELVFDKRLTKGVEIDSDTIKKYLYESLYKRLLRQAFAYLSIRTHSVSELQFYLTKKIRNLLKLFNLSEKFSVVDIINSVIDELKRRKYLDDYQFAKTYIEQQMQTKSKGSRALAYALMKKGIDKQIINSILNNKEIVSSENINSLIDKSITKIGIIIKSRSLDKRKAKEMLIRRLLSRGFEFGKIRSKIDDWIRCEYNREVN